MVWAEIQKRGGACERCGVTSEHFSFFDLHHRDPRLKDRNVLGLGLPRIKAELEKCDVLCPNCHRMVHIEMRLEEGK